MIEHAKETSWNVLQKKCLYEVRKNTIEYMNCSHKNILLKDLYKIQTENWLYYASFSPIWKRRIITFHGTIDHEKKSVEFDDEENDLHTFYQIYGYDPDEQSQTTFAENVSFRTDPSN